VEHCVKTSAYLDQNSGRSSILRNPTPPPTRKSKNIGLKVVVLGNYKLHQLFVWILNTYIHGEHRFYRTMHFSAKRGLAIACRPSVCLSVCPSVMLVDCDHIGWKSWKLIAQTISPTPSLFVSKRRSTYSQGNMGKFWGDYRWGREKVAFCITKAAISLKRVKIEEKLLWMAYRNSPTVFRTVPSPTPYGLPLCGHSQGPPQFLGTPY